MLALFGVDAENEEEDQHQRAALRVLHGVAEDIAKLRKAWEG